MKVTKAIIPAAGLGTRFLPITKAIPKPMLPIIDKPTIQYIVEEAAESGITDILIVVSPDTEAIVKHFTTNERLETVLESDGKTELLSAARGTSCGCNISFVMQDEPKGLGDAVLRGEKWLNGEPFALLLGDELIYHNNNEKPCIRQLADSFEKTGYSTVATMRVSPTDAEKYGNFGVVYTGERRMPVTGMVEKPKADKRLSDYAVIGRYVFSGEVMELLKAARPEKGEVYLTDAFLKLIEKGALDAYLFEGTRYDAGDKVGYVKANIGYALNNPQMKSEVLCFMKSMLEKYE